MGAKALNKHLPQSHTNGQQAQEKMFHIDNY